MRKFAPMPNNLIHHSEFPHLIPKLDLPEPPLHSRRGHVWKCCVTIPRLTMTPPVSRIRVLLCICLRVLFVSETTSFIAPRPFMVTKPHLFPPDYHGNQEVVLSMTTTPKQQDDEQNASEERNSPSLLDDNNNSSSNRNTRTTSACSPSPWNPTLRRIMGSIATMGVLETSFLTYSKLSSSTPSMDLCGTSGDCFSVLNGPYSVIPFTDIPLSALGLGAYAVTVLLTLLPLVGTKDSPEDETNNRMALLSLTTAMGTFSVFLMSLIYGVLHTSCPYCLASACFSITLAACAWLGGCLPEHNNPRREKGVQAGIASFVTTTAVAMAFFGSVVGDPVQDDTTFPTTTNSPAYLASSLSFSPSSKQKDILENMSPPPITTTSSERALVLSDNLSLYNAKMYGAYWCSHCYDQKQAFGSKAFSQIQYIECSKEGRDSQTTLCKERDVPGYPTWEINGKLYPGERDLVELEEILQDIQMKK